MKTIGQILKNARERKKYSLKKLEELTRIKKNFIDAVEKGNWDKLPAFPTVLGFVKSLSTTLQVDADMAVAVLKRDYPPKSAAINPKPDVSSRFVWGPKLTFTIGIIAFLFVVFGYLFFQYSKFISPPALDITDPKEGAIISSQTVLVAGSTDSDATITVNNQPVITNEDGKFSVEIAVTKDTKEIVVKAVSRSGKKTVVSRKIQIE